MPLLGFCPCNGILGVSDSILGAQLEVAITSFIVTLGQSCERYVLLCLLSTKI